MWNDLLEKIALHDTRALSRAISLIENQVEGYLDFLKKLPNLPDLRLTGITGPPGAGKSTIVDLLIGHWVAAGESVAVLCIDPSSAFTNGALLGDRVRMRQWHDNPLVYIRSLSTRGSLGGLHPNVIEISDVVKAAGFQHMIVETVGVGQSEISIAALADTTIVVQVPEGGDEIQTMKAGVMEIADIFVVNKCDRPGADEFIRNLKSVLHQGVEIPVVGMTASGGKGTEELAAAIGRHQQALQREPARQVDLLTEKAFQLILKNRMNGIDRRALAAAVQNEYGKHSFNVYALIEQF